MDREANRLIYSWLFAAVFSLVFAGAFAFLAAMTRTPAVKLLPSADYFRVSIVAHVIFSLTVWFFAFMSVLMAFTASRREIIKPRIWRLGFWLAIGGMALLAVSSILALGKPLLVDYVPLLDHPVYLAGLLLLVSGITVTIAGYWRTIFSTSGHELDVAAYGMAVVALINITAFSSIVFAAISLLASEYSASFESVGLNLKAIVGLLSSSYRVLFWGPGHIVQFSNTLAMIVVWLVLLESAMQRRVNENVAKNLMKISLLAALSLPLVYILPIYKQARLFTLGMAYGLGIPSVALALMIAKVILDGSRASGFKNLPWREPAFSSLIFSIALFSLGGVIGIPGLESNLRVPAHYHGSLGAVTMAFMGMTYLLLPSLRIKVFSDRVARIQPYLYGLGLLLIIVGLFWAGSYNAPRKAFGYEDPLTATAMNIMGAGAVISVIGGATFVANAMLSLLRGRNQPLDNEV